MKRPAVKRPDVKRPKIAIVGAGRVGSALALRLREAGYRITEVIVRDRAMSLARARRRARRLGASVFGLDSAHLRADLVWFCVPDGQIAAAAAELSQLDWRGKLAFHASGVLSSDELRALHSQGAQVASVHPLMTFVPGEVPKLQAVAFAVEGDRGAVRVASAVVSALGGSILRIRKQDKSAYHAFATMICPMLVSLLASAERAGAFAGITARRSRTAMLPIIHQTLANYHKLGAAKAFTGPIVRGDAEAVRRHLWSLADEPSVQQVYVALGQAALKNLPARNRELINAILDEGLSANSPKPRRSPRLKAV